MTMTTHWNSYEHLILHFTLEELVSPSCIELGIQPNFDAVFALQSFRYYHGGRLLVNHGVHKLRGLRTMADQQRLIDAGLTTATNSEHIAGNRGAFDISPIDCTLNELLDDVVTFNESTHLFGGVGLYDTFIHIDRRPCRPDGGPTAFWDYRDGEKW